MKKKTNALTAVPAVFLKRLTVTKESLQNTTALVSAQRHLSIGIVGIGLLVSSPSYSNPQGGTVVEGSATIVQESAQKLNVLQHTDKAIIDWNSFNIGVNEHTQFVQPSSNSIVLNRITGGDPSQILGRLTANGRVMIINPNGVLFGRDSKIDVNGLVASTHDIRNHDFLNGNYNFNIQGNPNASIINKGNISVADQGLVAFVAPSVQNQGYIAARLGKVALASANGFTLDLYGDQLISILVDDKVAELALDENGAPVEALVDNSGKITADGGYIFLSANAARGLVNKVVNNTGYIEARSIGMENGEIVLLGGDEGEVHVAGTLDASGDDAGETGGRILITGEKVGVMAGATINASGKADGGTVLVGGDYQGKGDTPRAQYSYVDETAKITTDATDKGNGGKLIVWSDKATNSYGELTSKGGVNGGDGGLIETSSKGHLDVGQAADASAANGKNGKWLLDPTDVTITSSTANTSTSTITVPASLSQYFTALNSQALLSEGTANTSTIAASTIVSALESGTDVAITTWNENGTATGDINITSDIIANPTTEVNLGLFAHNDINLQAGTKLQSTGSKMNLGLYAGNVHSGFANWGANWTFLSMNANVNLQTGTFYTNRGNKWWQTYSSIFGVSSETQATIDQTTTSTEKYAPVVAERPKPIDDKFQTDKEWIESLKSPEALQEKEPETIGQNNTGVAKASSSTDEELKSNAIAAQEKENQKNLMQQQEIEAQKEVLAEQQLVLKRDLFAAGVGALGDVPEAIRQVYQTEAQKLLAEWKNAGGDINQFAQAYFTKLQKRTFKLFNSDLIGQATNMKNSSQGDALKISESDYRKIQERLTDMYDKSVGELIKLLAKGVDFTQMSDEALIKLMAQASYTNEVYEDVTHPDRAAKLLLSMVGKKEKTIQEINIASLTNALRILVNKNEGYISDAKSIYSDLVSQAYEKFNSNEISYAAYQLFSDKMSVLSREFEAKAGDLDGFTQSLGSALLNDDTFKSYREGLNDKTWELSQAKDSLALGKGNLFEQVLAEVKAVAPKPTNNQGIGVIGSGMAQFDGQLQDTSSKKAKTDNAQKQQSVNDDNKSVQEEKSTQDEEVKVVEVNDQLRENSLVQAQVSLNKFKDISYDVFADSAAVANDMRQQAQYFFDSGQINRTRYQRVLKEISKYDQSILMNSFDKRIGQLKIPKELHVSNIQRSMVNLASDIHLKNEAVKNVGAKRFVADLLFNAVGRDENRLLVNKYSGREEVNPSYVKFLQTNGLSTNTPDYNGKNSAGMNLKKTEDQERFLNGITSTGEATQVTTIEPTVPIEEQNGNSAGGPGGDEATSSSSNQDEQPLPSNQNGGTQNSENEDQQESSNPSIDGAVASNGEQDKNNEQTQSSTIQISVNEKAAEIVRSYDFRGTLKDFIQDQAVATALGEVIEQLSQRLPYDVLTKVFSNDVSKTVLGNLVNNKKELLSKGLSGLKNGALEAIAIDYLSHVAKESGGLLAEDAVKIAYTGYKLATGQPADAIMTISQHAGKRVWMAFTQMKDFVEARNELKEAELIIQANEAINNLQIAYILEKNPAARNNIVDEMWKIDQLVNNAGQEKVVVSRAILGMVDTINKGPHYTANYLISNLKHIKNVTTEEVRDYIQNHIPPEDQAVLLNQL